MDRQWLIAIVLLVAVFSPAVPAQEVEVQDASDIGAIEKFLLSLELIFSPLEAAEKVAPLYAYSRDVVCQEDSWNRVVALNPEHAGLAAIVFYREEVPRAQYYPTIYAARHTACRQDDSPGQSLSRGGDPNATAGSWMSFGPGQSPSGDPNTYIATTFPLIGSEAERRFLVRGRERVPSGWAEPAR